MKKFWKSYFTDKYYHINHFVEDSFFGFIWWGILSTTVLHLPIVSLLAFIIGGFLYDPIIYYFTTYSKGIVHGKVILTFPYLLSHCIVNFTTISLIIFAFSFFVK